MFRARHCEIAALAPFMLQKRRKPFVRMRGNGWRRNDESKESSTNEAAKHTNMAAMQGYEIFLPPPLTLARPPRQPKSRKSKTHWSSLRQLCALEPPVGRREAMGDVSFHDEVTIVRVLGDGSEHLGITAFKKSIETALSRRRCSSSAGRSLLCKMPKKEQIEVEGRELTISDLDKVFYPERPYEGSGSAWPRYRSNGDKLRRCTFVAIRDDKAAPNLVRET